MLTIEELRELDKHTFQLDRNKKLPKFKKAARAIKYNNYNRRKKM